MRIGQLEVGFPWIGTSSGRLEFIEIVPKFPVRNMAVFIRGANRKAVSAVTL